ncbi:helix-turn-helix transcriptional regulator [Ferrovibrio sp.]|uniref:helix-turn-helix domain-containing protein n=1 Tax=Ferrovibrio sp. TaxID=1917215 RepID=UPI00311E9FA3
MDDNDFIGHVNNPFIDSATIVRRMKTPAERLRHAIKKKYDSASAFAKAAGEKPVTVRAIWNGVGGLTQQKAAKYARILGCEAQWLLYGSGRGPDGKVDSGEPEINVAADFAKLRPALQQYLADQIARLARGDERLTREYLAEMAVARVVGATGTDIGSGQWYEMVAAEITARHDSEAGSPGSTKK